MRSFELISKTVFSASLLVVMSATTAMASVPVPERCQSELYEAQYLQSYDRGHDYVVDYFVALGTDVTERCSEYAEFSEILSALIDMWSLPEEATDLVYCVYQGRRAGMTTALDDLDQQCSGNCDE